MKTYLGNAIAASTFDSEENATQWFIRGGEIRMSAHDTTDDFMLMAGDASRNVEIEFTFDEGIAIATWLLMAVQERHSQKGQVEQQRDRDEAEKQAGHPIEW